MKIVALTIENFAVIIYFCLVNKKMNISNTNLPKHLLFLIMLY